jgi:SAM-dependent methyltransferase
VSGAYYLSPELYDAVYADVVADIAPHVALVREAGGPALELCAGNGRLLLPALDAGVACDALDLSAEMLESLHAKLAARGWQRRGEGAAARFRHADGREIAVQAGDMRDFSLAMRYELIVIGFNSFLHNLTQDDQLATLRCCRHHLTSGGRLVLSAFHPSAEKLIEWASGERMFKDIPAGDGRVRVYDHAQDDRVEQVRNMTRRIEFTDAAGNVTRRESVKFLLRYAYKPEMELLLHVAGFSRWEARPAFEGYFTDAGEPAGERALREGDVIAWTAWKD